MNRLHDDGLISHEMSVETLVAWEIKWNQVESSGNEGKDKV
jgi:hypothetical protein